MKKGVRLLFLILVLSSTLYAQVEDRFSQLNEINIKEYARPFATSLGTAMNSGGFYTASVPTLFGFSLSFRGMYIMVPDDQKTFTPQLPQGYNADVKSATIYGDKGGYYSGPAGYVTLPPGIDVSAVPLALPQIAASFMGTEVMLRYLPAIPLGDDSEISMLGVGVKHSISRYIPLLPVDIAAQFLYNNIEITNLFNVNNIAFNAHASKTFGLFTPYFGLQYESTSVDISYTLKGNPDSGDPSLQQDREISTSIDGDNGFRATLGGALKLAVLVLNADINLGSQTAFTGGITFEF
jgi:hypothetical protein